MIVSTHCRQLSSPVTSKLTRLSVRPSLPMTTTSCFSTFHVSSMASFMGVSFCFVPSCIGQLKACCISVVWCTISPLRMMKSEQSPRLATCRESSWRTARRHVDDPRDPCMSAWMRMMMIQTHFGSEAGQTLFIAFLHHERRIRRAPPPMRFIRRPVVPSRQAALPICVFALLAFHGGSRS